MLATDALTPVGFVASVFGLFRPHHNMPLDPVVAPLQNNVLHHKLIRTLIGAFVHSPLGIGFSDSSQSL